MTSLNTWHGAMQTLAEWCNSTTAVAGSPPAVFNKTRRRE